MSLDEIKEQYAEENHYNNWQEIEDNCYSIDDIKKDFDRVSERYAQQRVNDVLEEEKKYQIDFNGHVLAGLTVKNNKIEIFGAMNGFGKGIRMEDIKISELEDQP